LRRPSLLDRRNQIGSAHASSMRQDRVLGCVLAGPREFPVTQTVSIGNNLIPIDVGRVEKGESCAHDLSRGFSRRHCVLDNGIKSTKESSVQQSRVIEQLPAFDRIPASKLGVVPLMFRFALAGRSVAVYTERLGSRPQHGRVAILVNEHSASAAEMVAAFASEYGLATLVGVRTPGRLVGASAFKVGFGYRLALPVATYFTWKGTNLEGKGVEPDVPEPISPEALWRGEDNQLAKARGLLTHARQETPSRAL